ncbi:MAG: hypothetical protein HOV81_07295, partial [Kofleriaceae bacterium]|nr:hypothetical protein [Kofleriaceae bacterium]
MSAGRAWAQPEKPAQPEEQGAGAAPTADAKPADAEPDSKPDPATVEPPKASLDEGNATDRANTKATHLTYEVPSLVTIDRAPIRGEGFRFGSYGRVLAGSDLRGGKPEKVAIVAHAPRVVEASYLELELSYGFAKIVGFEGVDSYIALRPIITLAFDGTLFHDTGEFDAHPALRNMFLDARLGRDLTAWVGSRMYRGDDIYLFDYWPLDDQNTVGAGIAYRRDLTPRANAQSDQLSLAAHVGFNRLQNDFQFQEIEVPNPVQGATTVDQLNRQ